MADLPQILTSNSAYSAFQDCPRKRWWGYEAPSQDAHTHWQDGNPHLVPERRGWERRSLSLPLATGGWCHRVAQGMFVIASGGNLSALWNEVLREVSPELADASESLCVLPGAISYAQWIGQCVLGYRAEAKRRGLDLGLQMDGSVPEEAVAERVIEEQGALLEAFGWAFLRVRLPRLLEEYELVDVEREEVSLLSADVGLQGRCDAVLRRRSDQRLFIYNLKTSSNPSDKRWQDHWQVDQQLMTETLAVERRLNERVYGVIIDGFDKGQRVRMDFCSFKERPKDGVAWYEGQRSRLIYGYKCEETVPGRPTLYDYEGTTRKGWEKFAVWLDAVDVKALGATAVERWINWLPQEQVEASFVTLPPIMREDRKVQRKVNQMVHTEQRIRSARNSYDAATSDRSREEHLDVFFGTNEHSCHYPYRCWAYAICHEDVDPSQDGRFVPRKANHPVEGE